MEKNKPKPIYAGTIAILAIILCLVPIASFLFKNTEATKGSVDPNDLIQPDFTSTDPSKSEAEWRYSFPGDSEFSKNKFYSIGWLEEGILLVRSDLVKSDFGYRGAKIGHAPNFAKAITEIKRSYTIITRIPMKLSNTSVRDPSPSTDGLLLEVEPKKAEPKKE